MRHAGHCRSENSFTVTMALGLPFGIREDSFEIPAEEAQLANKMQDRTVNESVKRMRKS